MRGTPRPPVHRFDRTLRVVMWSDAALSVAMVAVGLVASPVVAVLGVPASIRFGLALGALVTAGLLAAFGAITAVVLMLRMRSGEYGLPPRLWLPLPPGMRPSMYAPRGTTASAEPAGPSVTVT